MTLVRPIKMCLKETCSKVRIAKYILRISYSEWSETNKCNISSAFKLCFRIFYQRNL